MSSLATSSRVSVIPCLRYRNATAAIEWLCQTFRFERHLVVPGPDDTIAHAQLTFADRTGMIMLGSVVDSEYGRNMVQPDELGLRNTQGLYLVVPDPDAVYDQAKSAGAKILIDIKDEDYGGRGFTCLDLEGHVWSFGSYDPW